MRHTAAVLALGLAALTTSSGCDGLSDDDSLIAVNAEDQAWVRCARDYCDVRYATDARWYFENQRAGSRPPVLNSVPRGQRMGTWAVDENIAAVSYPMPDRNDAVQIAYLDEGWVPENFPALGVWPICVNDTCPIYYTDTLDSPAPPLMGYVERGTVVGRFAQQGGLTAVSYPMPDRGNAVQVIRASDGDWMFAGSDPIIPDFTQQRLEQDYIDDPNNARGVGYYYKVPGTPIGVRVSVESHHLGGCIGRVAWHVGLLFNFHAGPSKGKLITDLHVAFWSNGGGDACVAVYESASGFCTRTCGSDISNKTQEVADTMAEAIASALRRNNFTVTPELQGQIATAAVVTIGGAFLLATLTPAVPPPP